MLSPCRLARCFARLAATSAAAFAAQQQQQQQQQQSARGLRPRHTTTSLPHDATTQHRSDGDDDDGDDDGSDRSPRHREAVTLWVDDTAAETHAREAHVRSAAYKELHRRPMTTSGMGLFGGEPGFEKAFRVWVDPDRPHMKHIYNQTPLARNLRYARYGYFKRDMHILDVDKLIRHARMLPMPSRLLTDFLYQRVSLSDRSCAALLRYQREQLDMLDESQRQTQLRQAEEMFERMLVTNIPSVEVGVAAHAEMVRCCAVCGEWRKGWHVYYARAREVEASAGDGSGTLDTNLFDAVLELCVACARPRAGMCVVRDAIARHLRPRTSMLNRVLTLASIAVEQLDARMTRDGDGDGVMAAEDDDDDDDGNGDHSGRSDHNDNEATALQLRLRPSTRLRTCDDVVQQRGVYAQCGLEAWALFDFYALARDTHSIECYLRLCGMLGDAPTRALEALGVADGAGIATSLTCYSWTLYAARVVPDLGDVVMDVFAQLPSRGLTPDYVLFTMAFLYCAAHRDGELALAVYRQCFVASQVRPTPEMVLLMLQACARCARPRVAMLHACEELLEQLERSGSVVDLAAEHYDQLLHVAAHVGAVAVAFSRVKKLASLGKPLTTRLLNALLLANARAAAPVGGVAMLREVMQLFRVVRVRANRTTLARVQLCRDAHGSDADVDAWCASLQQQQQQLHRATTRSLDGGDDNNRSDHTSSASSRNDDYVDGDDDDDTDVPVRHTPPHRLRQLHVAWKLRPRDTALRRYGQTLRPQRVPPAGSPIGSVVPFGRAPGERAV